MLHETLRSFVYLCWTLLPFLHTFTLLSYFKDFYLLIKVSKVFILFCWSVICWIFFSDHNQLSSHSSWLLLNFPQLTKFLPFTTNSTSVNSRAAGQWLKSNGSTFANHKLLFIKPLQVSGVKPNQIKSSEATGWILAFLNVSLGCKSWSRSELCGPSSWLVVFVWPGDS